ncbi:MAG: pilin [Candidatus Paceibacterota bacterium]|nr:MAG: pilin [Candidatus Paceibacterota bacterium]
MNKRNIKILAGALLALAVFSPALVLAAEINIPTPPVQSTTTLDLTKLEDLLKQIANFILTIGLILAVIYIGIGGIKWIMSADDKGAGAAKEQIWNGIKGAAVILAIGLILNTLASLISRGSLR